jgi:hypothetical protein
MADGAKPYGKLVVSGALSITLYALLYAFEAEIMAYFTRTDGLYFLLPIAAAFAFSLAHGAFTGYFWDVIGIQGKPQNGKQ